MELPNRELRRVSARKVTAYLLDLEHPDGGSKARFFLAFGFDAVSLTDALMAHPMQNPVDRIATTPHGRQHIVRGPVQAPDGRQPRITSVWIVREDGAPDLVTAYPGRS